MHKLLMIALAGSTAFAGAAQAQVYGPGPRPAYAAAGWYDGGDCGGGGRLTLLGAHAGVTVLGVDVGASAGLHVGLHDRCRGGGRAVYAAPPQEAYGPPQYEPEAYGPPPGYGGGYYPQPAYAQGGYGPMGGYGYAYAAPAGYGYGPPCGC